MDLKILAGRGPPDPESLLLVVSQNTRLKKGYSLYASHVVPN